MNKYELIEKTIHTVFGSKEWEKTQIKTIPSNFSTTGLGSEFIRMNILTGGNGLNLQSLSGLLIIDIFTSAGDGPMRATLIADTLDTFFVGKSLTASKGKVVQFMASTTKQSGPDRDNPTLNRVIYSLPFNFFGA